MRYAMRWLVAILVITVIAGSYFAFQRSVSFKTLEQANLALEAGDLVQAQTLAAQSKHLFADTQQADQADLIIARAELQWLLQDPNRASVTGRPDPTVLLHNIQSAAVFPIARQLLCEHYFFDQHRFDLAYKLLEESRLQAPTAPQLMSEYWKINSLCGCWLEACELTPTTSMTALSEEESQQYLKDYTMLVFFPDQYRLALDRRLGLLSHHEMPNRNTELDRWILLADGGLPSANAAAADWYQNRGAEKLAQEQLKAGELSSKALPMAIYFEQRLLVYPHASNRDALVQAIEQLGTEGRIQHAELLQQGLATGDLKWPIVVDRPMLEHLARALPDDEKVKQHLERLDRWTKERRDEMLTALEQPGANNAVLRECWNDFGRPDIANLFAK